jgi:hypothetical protein
MNKNLGLLISLGLELDLFFSLSIGEYDVRLMGFYSKKLENYILSKGFIMYDYLYSDNPNYIEFNKDGCAIILVKK